jgi:hypothetical protein
MANFNLLDDAPICALQQRSDLMGSHATMADAWADCQDVEQMFSALRYWGHDQNVLRSFACAAIRQVWHLLPDPRSRAAVETAEMYARGDATAEELAAARRAAPVSMWVNATSEVTGIKKAACGALQRMSSRRSDLRMAAADLHRAVSAAGSLEAAYAIWDPQRKPLIASWAAACEEAREAYWRVSELCFAHAADAAASVADEFVGDPFNDLLHAIIYDGAKNATRGALETARTAHTVAQSIYAAPQEMQKLEKASDWKWVEIPVRDDMLHQWRALSSELADELRCRVPWADAEPTLCVERARELRSRFPHILCLDA